MLQFFFTHPGAFYGFGYDGNRKIKNERWIEHAIYTYLTDPSSSYKFPKYSGEKAAAFGADLFFKHYLSLFPNIKIKELKKGIDLDMLNNYSLSVNSLIFFLFNYIQLLEDINDKRFDDLLIFLKKFLNCLVDGDFLSFKNSSFSFNKDIQLLSCKFVNDANILLLFDILSLFLTVFQKRLGYGNINVFFKKKTPLTFSTFVDSCLVPEKIAQCQKIEDIIELCYVFGKKLIDLRSVLMTGHGQDDYSLFEDLNMDTYIYGAGFKLN